VKIGCEAIKVGLVEDFQGGEKDVIIISTVRGLKSIDADVEYDRGFLQNDRSYNVAVSRAKAMLVVVGNCDVLVRAKNWRYLIEKCDANQSCVNFKGFGLGAKIVDDDVACGVEKIVEEEARLLGQNRDYRWPRND